MEKIHFRSGGQEIRGTLIKPHTLKDKNPGVIFFHGMTSSENVTEKEINERSIVFVERSKKLPFGHFLCKFNNQWMDPWINIPNTPINGGFREKLSGKPTYVIYPVKSN